MSRTSSALALNAMQNDVWVSNDLRCKLVERAPRVMCMHPKGNDVDEGDVDDDDDNDDYG